jgi:23S rRNA pseudouridine2605 synthase
LSVRLNKLLAQRGIGARRKCDELIQRGAVQVNGVVVREPGTQVEPERDRVAVNGRPLPAPAPLRYFALNKPVGVITTLHDPEGRRTIAEFLPPGPRLYPVGRLDADTSGLLILTNDGELAHKLMHPRYGVEKVYRVRVAAAPDARQVERLERGVEFEPGVRSAPARVKVLDETPGGSLVSIALHEGRYRQVRRMFEAVGLQVMGLHRSAYGPLRLKELARGLWRELSDSEVAQLRAASARPQGRGRGHHSRVGRGGLSGRPARRRPDGGAPMSRGGEAPRSKPFRRSSAEAAFGVPQERGPRRRPRDAGPRDTPRPPRGESRRGGTPDRPRRDSRPRRDDFAPRGRGPRPSGPPRGGAPRSSDFGPARGRRGAARTGDFGPARGPRGAARTGDFGPARGRRGAARTGDFGPARGRRGAARAGDFGPPRGRSSRSEGARPDGRRPRPSGPGRRRDARPMGPKERRGGKSGAGKPPGRRPARGSRRPR